MLRLRATACSELGYYSLALTHWEECISFAATHCPPHDESMVCYSIHAALAALTSALRLAYTIITLAVLVRRKLVEIYSSSATLRHALAASSTPSPSSPAPSNKGITSASFTSLTRTQEESGTARSSSSC